MSWLSIVGLKYGFRKIGNVKETVFKSEQIVPQSLNFKCQSMCHFLFVGSSGFLSSFFNTIHTLGETQAFFHALVYTAENSKCFLLRFYSFSASLLNAVVWEI